MAIAIHTQSARTEGDEGNPSHEYESRTTGGFAQSKGYGDYFADSREAGRARPVALGQGIDEAFAELATRWRAETSVMSATHDVVLHPAYMRIIGLGASAVPLLIRELQERPEPWFWALTALTGDDPTEGTDTFDGAVQAWLTWARDKGLL